MCYILPIARSSNGRTAAFEAVNLGSIPGLAANNTSMIYSLLFIVAYLILYIVLNYGIQFVLNKRINKKTFKKKSFTFILLASIIIFSIVFLIKDPEFSNRFQHAIAGGFLAMLVSYLAFKDSQAKINKLQMILLSILIVTFLGVLNEIAEFLGEIFTSLVFADNIYDTWYDLTSNLFGIILGCVFVLFDKNIQK